MAEAKASPNTLEIGLHPKTGKPITLHGLNKRPFLKRGLQPVYLPTGANPHEFTPEMAADLFAKPPERQTLIRTERFPIIFATEAGKEKEVVLWKIGGNLRKVWDAHEARFRSHTDEHFESFYREFETANDAAKALAKRRKKEGDTPAIKAEAKAIRERRTEINNRLKPVRKAHPYPTDIELINGLDVLRGRLGLGDVNRNWQEETTKLFTGAYKSYLTSRVNGDYTDKMAGPKDPGQFPGILGRTGFRYHGEAGTFELIAKKLAPDVTLSFPVPEYQRRQISRGKVKSFTVSLDKDGVWWIGVNYEIPKPATRPFEREHAVCIALGASSIGVVSARGKEVIPFWRSDFHWLPRIRAVEEWLKHESVGTNIHALTPGSKQWQKLQKARGRMFATMSRQQKQNRREVVAIDLIEKVVDNCLRGHGVHFVVTEHTIRGKKGKLADSSKKGRGGDFGLNRAAQSTGMGYFVQWLKEKAAEYGGTVQMVKLPYDALPKGLPIGHENKISMAEAVRDHFLSVPTAA